MLSLDAPVTSQVLDLGTGTGCIAITLAAERPSWQVSAVDFSKACVELAQRNAKQMGVTNISFCSSDWYSGLSPGLTFDIIVSNPPYVDPASHYLNEGDVRFEPHSALTASEKGLADIENIIAKAPRYLKPNGNLWLEHGFDQAQAVRGLLSTAGFVEVATDRDFGGNDRCSGGRFLGKKETE